METTTKLLYPNLKTPDDYHRLLTHFANALMHEPIMVRNRRGVKVVNGRRYDIDAKMTAASAEAVARFGHRTMCPNAYCRHCNKPLVGTWSSVVDNPECGGSFDKAKELYCRHSDCVKVKV